MEFTEYLEPTTATYEIANSLRPKSTYDAIVKATRWAHRNIKYVPDKKDIFSSPNVTLNRGYGDCEDKAFLIASILRSLPKEYRPKYVSVAIGYVGLIPGYHAWAVCVDDKNRIWYCDGTNGMVMPVNILYRPLMYIEPNRIRLAKEVSIIRGISMLLSGVMPKW